MPSSSALPSVDDFFQGQANEVRGDYLAEKNDQICQECKRRRGFQIAGRFRLVGDFFLNGRVLN